MFLIYVFTKTHRSKFAYDVFIFFIDVVNYTPVNGLFHDPDPFPLSIDPLSMSSISLDSTLSLNVCHTQYTESLSESIRYMWHYTHCGYNL